MSCPKCNNKSNFEKKVATVNGTDIEERSENLYLENMGFTSGYGNTNKIYLMLMCCQCENIIKKTPLKTSDICSNCKYSGNDRRMLTKRYTINKKEQTVTIEGNCKKCNYRFEVEAKPVDSRIYKFLYSRNFI